MSRPDPQPRCATPSPSRRRCGPAGRRDRRERPRPAPCRPPPRSRHPSASRPLAPGRRRRAHGRRGSATAPRPREPPRAPPPRRRHRPRGRSHPPGPPPRSRRHRDPPTPATPNAASRSPPRLSRHRRRPRRRTAPPPPSRPRPLSLAPTGPPAAVPQGRQQRHRPTQGSHPYMPPWRNATAQRASTVRRNTTVGDSQRCVTVRRLQRRPSARPRHRLASEVSSYSI